MVKLVCSTFHNSPSLPSPSSNNSRSSRNRRGNPARPLQLASADLLVAPSGANDADFHSHESDEQDPRPSTRRPTPAIDLRELLRRPHAPSDRSAPAHIRLAERLKPALEHVELLAPAERTVLEAVIRSGLSFSVLQQLTGQSIRAVRTTLRNAAQRASSDLFAFVATHRHAMPPMRRAVAEAMVLRGMSLRAIAAELNVSLWTVRTQRQRVLNQYLSSHNAGHPAHTAQPARAGSPTSPSPSAPSVQGAPHVR